MKRSSLPSDAYLVIATIFLALQLRLNFQVNLQRLAGDEMLALLASMLAVTVIVGGWLLRFSAWGGRHRALMLGWHAALLCLVGLRIEHAVADNQAAVGDRATGSYVWLLACSMMVVLTIAHVCRRLRMAAPPAVPLTAAHALATQPGRIGKYELRGVLGRGAMGTVHEAYDPQIARRVAIKVVDRPQPGDPEAAEVFARFQREAQAAGRLRHPNIVAVYDYGETPEFAYMVMEHVDGPTLAALTDGNRLPLDQSLGLMQDLLAGLQHSHESGVVHRDIKPANVMVTRDGTAKITDFGIARVASSELTEFGKLLGSAACMSPEQFMGEAVDHRTDIYAAGILFYRLLTGERPFEGSITTIMNQVLTCEPPMPSARGSGVSPQFDAVIARAMARLPDDRFASAAAFAQALREARASLAGEATLVLPSAATLQAAAAESD